MKSSLGKSRYQQLMQLSIGGKTGQIVQKDTTK